MHGFSLVDPCDSLTPLRFLDRASAVSDQAGLVCEYRYQQPRHSSLSRIDLNDRGQLAFVATLSDGREGIFRADPALEPTPEPPTLLLWGTVMAGLGIAARWGKRNQT